VNLRWFEYEDLDSLCATVELTTAANDPALYLADVLTHLANHKPLTEGDEQAYRIVKASQERFWTGGLSAALGNFPDVNTLQSYYAGCE
jgi:hypothetical protein